MSDAPRIWRWSGLPIIGPLARYFQGAPKGAPPPDTGLSPETKTYHCGTLTYAKAGLVAVFAWLLWGDFCLTLMEDVVPTVLPLKLDALGCPKALMGAIMATIPGVLNMALNPIISFKSDAHRGRWGRRIPFIAWTLPFLCLSLVLLGYSEDISIYLQGHMPVLRDYAPATVTIALIAVFMVIFQFFNMFVGTTFYYLFNDVVPPNFLARFMATFRIVGHGATVLYNFFVFQYSLTNMREIFVGAALLYFVGFTLMCWRVKEGQYPPVESEKKRPSKGWAGAKTFLRESFCHKWYWLFFVWTSIGVVGGGIGMFNVFFTMEMGMTTVDIGQFRGVIGVVSMIAMYLAAVFIDRWHPIRVQAYAAIFAAFGALGGWVWIFVTLPGKVFFWLSLGGGLIGTFLSATTALCGLPLAMRILPKSRYGQFCASQAVVQSFLRLFSGVLAGLFLDIMTWMVRNAHHGPRFVYRFNFVWSGFFAIVTCVFAIWAYIYWYRLGGDKNYRPPAPWKAEQSDLDLGRLFFDTLMWLPALCLPALIWWTYRCRELVAVHWSYILAALFVLAAAITFRLLLRRIPRDWARCHLRKPPQNGFTHSDIVIAICFKYLLILCAWATQIIFLAKFENEMFYTAGRHRSILPTYYMVVAAALAVWAYHYWTRRGEPAPSSASATEPPPELDLTEEVDPVVTVPPQSRWLSCSLRLFSAVMWLPLVCLPAVIGWMHYKEATVAERWYLQLILPCTLAVWGLWKLLERAIRRDMARSLRNEPLRNGIPHHGMLMLIAVKNVLAFSIWVAQVFVTLHLNMQRECVLFAIAHVMACLTLTGAVYTIWRMERGWSSTLDISGGDGGPSPGAKMVVRIKALFGRKPRPETA